MVLVTKGDFIWVDPFPAPSPSSPDALSSIPFAARVLDSDKGRLKIVDDLGQEEWLDAARRVKLMHPTSVQGCEDMIRLGDFHESAVLRNIFVRYREKMIYTYTGSILIAVNPYMDIPIYTAEQIRMYRRKRIGELPPHIFAIADNAYTNMRAEGRDQSVVISGESGAGKTESTKLVLQFLATASGQHSWIEQQVLEANPILEAFGNAKTVRNDNSSRFGKYIDVHFNQQGAIEGARIEQYLLEKSRIVSQSMDERNYHIFYCLLSGASDDERRELDLATPGEYFYLNQGHCLSCPSRDDAGDWSEVKSAMRVLLFKDGEIAAITRLLAALLHIGNIKIRTSLVDNMEAASVTDHANVQRIARLLQVDPSLLIECLTTKSLVTREERVVTPLSAQQSLDSRDALAKGIYGRLFEFIVNRINDAIYKPRGDSSRRSSIGVLDIFGFENFEHNSFSQLCINLANEHLQQFFIRHVFKMEQAEYDMEQISWAHISFSDNQETLDLIAARPMNIMSLIDEESIFPKGTDQTMLNKLHSNHSRHSLYSKPKSDLQKAFGVTHFAGPVFYQARGFLEKNRDAFSADLHSLVHSSRLPLIARLFEDRLYGEATKGRKGATLSGQFRRSLDALMASLQQTEPFFIRCIKPNEMKRPLVMDRHLVLRQLRYSGMLETIRIRRAGYPIRHEFEPFVARYRVLVDGIPPSHKTDCHAAARRICQKVLGESADFQLGKTKLFLKDTHQLFLEQEYYRMLNHRATTIQKAVRGWNAKRKFQRQRSAAVLIQTAWRGWEQRRRYKQIVLGFARLQAVLRSRQLQQHYQSMRYTIVQFQAQCRGALLRREFREIRARGQKRALAERAEREAEERRREQEQREKEQMTDSEMVGQLFDFLPADSRSEMEETPQTPQSVRNTTAHSVAKSSSASSITSKSSKSSVPAPPPQAPPTPPAPADPFNGEDLSMYQFGKFAATYFLGQQNAQHVKTPLKQPLLQHEEPSNQLASMAVWLTMLRFMGDLPEVPTGSGSGDSYDKTPVMTKLYTTLGRKFSRKDVEEASIASEYEAYGGVQKIRKSTVGRKLISLTLKKKSKINGLDSSSDRSSVCSSDSSFHGLLDNRPMSSLDKLHYIIGLGILREDLRDEIYCQLLKQLTNNPSRMSSARGWVLLSLCVGCFAPSERFIKYLFCFIRERGPSGPSGYAGYVEQRLTRTLLNGTRHQPPSYLELQANKSKKPLVLNVTFMDGRITALNADSATTAEELCRQLAEKVGLKERFGFSLYIALFDKVSSLGAGQDHVLDAVSQCEQYAKEQGRQARDAPWRLFFRKEIFSPWHNPKDDAVSTALIYQQVVRGIRYGEYRCDRDEDLAVLAAQQFYVDEGAMDVSRLEAALPGYLPDSDQGSKEKWLQTVMHQYRKKFGSSQPPGICVQEEVVAFAQFKWPLLFSRFYEALKFAGPPIPKNEVIVAVNWTGVYVVDDNEQVLLEFSFPEVAAVLHCKGKRIGSDTFTLRTVTGEEYTFQSPNSEDIRSLVDYFLEGLKRRSRYLVATRPQRAGEGDSLLEFERGDLLVLSTGCSGELLLEEQAIRGENQRTGRQGMIRAEAVYVLPTLIKPSVSTMAMFPKDVDFTATVDENANRTVALVDSDQRPHTLERFAGDNFRAPVSRTMTLRRRDPASNETWRFSMEPIRAPLLKKLEHRKDPSREALASYVHIMKYMGDHESRRSRIGTYLTDCIFRPALQFEVLRDELYCQLMKQLTFNPSMLSEERGWELLWMAAGLFPPSNALGKEVTRFLRTRQHPIAADCYNRIQKITKAGQRQYPPHQVEVEAIQHKTTQIYHKVFLPDHSDEAVEVESCSRAKDLVQRIASRLGVRRPDGFSLFVKINDKVLSVPDHEFFFDFVRQLGDACDREGAGGKTPLPFTYQVYFMRKLWLRTVPGEDRVADVIFHYHQECPKYLHGFHKCSKGEAIDLACLILRARTRDDKPAPLAQISSILSELVPRDLLKQQSSSDWKKSVTSRYPSVTASMTSDDAKVSFLTYIAEWPTFGSAFFEVAQSSDQSLPSQLLVAINKNGVALYDTHDKNLLVQYPFQSISNWTKGSTYFHITVGNLMNAKRLLLETSLGYKMDDLLNSYISVPILAQTVNPRLTHIGSEI